MSKKRKSFKQDIPTLKIGVEMEKSDKPLTRDALISMQVIDSKARLVGEVKDVTFEIGKSGISLAVQKKNGSIQSISWDEVQAISDFIILKPQPEPVQQVQPQVMYQPQPQMQPAYQPAPQQPQQAAQPMCPTCGKPLTWIPQYKRWYCYNEKKYV